MSIENAIERQFERKRARSETRTGANGLLPIGMIGPTIEQKFFTGTCAKHGNWRVFLLCGKSSDGAWKPLGRQAECPLCAEERERAEAEAEKQKQLEAEAVKEEMERRRLKDERERALNRSDIPSLYVRSSFASYRAKTPICKESKRQLELYAERFQEIRQKGIGLFLYGPTGTGKTHLACALIHALIDQGVNCRFVNCVKLLQEAIELGFEKSKLIEPLIKVDFLVLDEIGLQGGTKTEERILFTLIDARVNARKPTVFTSNVQPDSKETEIVTVRKIIGDRVYDRIQWKTVMLKLDGESHRKRYKSVDDILNDLENDR